MTDKSIYGVPTGHLSILSDRLALVVSGLDAERSNYQEVVQEYYAVLMHGLMQYFDGEIMGEGMTLDRAREISRRFSRKFLDSLTAEDVDARRNYEDLEQAGDLEWKRSMNLVYLYWLDVRNKTIRTVLRHAHENTKALSDLAKILHLGPLILSGGHSRTEDLYEDVFEAALGAMFEVQREIQRDPGAPEREAFCADNGFSLRLAKLVLSCTDAKYEDRVPPKTFFSSLQRLYPGLKSREIADDGADPAIVFSADDPVVSAIARDYGVDAVALGRALNCRYVPEDPGTHRKIFSNVVHGDLVRKLERAGLDERAVQARKNLAHVPPNPELRALLGTVSAEALAKNYWLGISVPKESTAARRVLVASLYCADPKQNVITRKVAGYSRMDAPDAVRDLMGRIRTALASAPTARERLKKRSVRAAFSLKYDKEEAAPTGVAGRAEGTTERPRPGWSFDIGITALQASKPKYAGIAGDNARRTGAASMRTALLDGFRSAYGGSATVVDGTAFTLAATDRAYAASLTASAASAPLLSLVPLPEGKYGRIMIEMGCARAHITGTLPPLMVAGVEALCTSTETTAAGVPAIEVAQIILSDHPEPAPLAIRAYVDQVAPGHNQNEGKH